MVCCDKLARLRLGLPEIDYLLVIVTLFFAIFFTLFLLTASFSVHDARWPTRHTIFGSFSRRQTSELGSVALRQGALVTSPAFRKRSDR